MAKRNKRRENRPSATSWTSPPNQQMDRSEDPQKRAEEDRDAASDAMHSGTRNTSAGSADDVGSIGYDEEGAFDVTGASEEARKRHPQVGDRAKP
jgi:hypothetical protein